MALAAGVFSVRAEPLISEIMASNTKTLADQNGAFSDWIELHNPEAAAVDLAGWYLADSAQTVEVTSSDVGAATTTRAAKPERARMKLSRPNL